MPVTAEQQKWAEKVSARQNCKEFAKQEILKDIDEGRLVANSKDDIKMHVAAWRASGKDHYFAGPPREKEPRENPFHPATFNISEQGRLHKVNASLAASKAAQVGPGAFLGMTIEQARRAAAAKASLK